MLTPEQIDTRVICAECGRPRPFSRLRPMLCLDCWFERKAIYRTDPVTRRQYNAALRRRETALRDKVRRRDYPQAVAIGRFEFPHTRHGKQLFRIDTQARMYVLDECGDVEAWSVRDTSTTLRKFKEIPV